MTIGKECFVIMPFGEKKDAEDRVIDFDAIYEKLIRGSIEGKDKACPGFDVQCKRCDEIAEGGWIHRKMIQRIHESDLAVVDLTTLNPNVFYELGVRHALVPAGTLLIRREGTKLPFNITGFNTISYPELAAEDAVITDFQDRLAQFACNALTVGGVDSLVHEAVDVEIRTISPPIRETRTFEYEMSGSGSKRVGLITGDIVNVKSVDAWVNSENTNMQMDRHVGGSISSVIRYFGAKKDQSDCVEDDLVAVELAKAMKGRRSVNPGSVIVTTAGRLRQRNGVKRIFHVASVIGQVRVGYRPVPDLGACVERVLEKAASPENKRAGIRSILFPLIGTGTARGVREKRARELIGAAVSFFVNNPSASVDRVYFLTWTEAELDVCSRILEQDPRLEAVKLTMAKGKPASARSSRNRSGKKADPPTVS